MNRGKRNYRGINRNIPWRGGQQRQHNEHDDRTKDGDVKRRVTFKPQGRLGKGGGIRISDMSVRAAFEDDQDMNDNEGIPKFANRQGVNNKRGGFVRRGSPPPRGINKKRLIFSASGWFCIMIPFGQKYDKDFIIRSLMEQLSPNVFIPYYYEVTTSEARFFVDDFKTAEKLVDLDRKISLPNGFKMLIKVKPLTPKATVNEEFKAKIKKAMAKRYNTVSSALDLTQFHADPDLLDVFCGLFRPMIMSAAAEVISQNIPELRALKLNSNKLHQLEHFKNICPKLPQVKVLHLADNRINMLPALDALKGWSLVELDLSGNPVRERYKDANAYVSEVRKRFPKLMKLDGIDLPKPIGFDIEDEAVLPQAKASFLCNSAGADIVRQFLEQYFVIYDSNDRQPLINAYHENAMFSMTVCYTQHQTNQQRLTPYLAYNRNVLRSKDIDVRCRQLKMGRLPIVTLLTQLPSTQHDPQSFGVDLTLFTEKLILLTVTGVFKERKTNGSAELVRSFQRSMLIVPAGSGYCIRNELMHVNVATAKQERTIFAPPPTLTSPSNFQSPVNATETGAALNDERKQMMVIAMSNQSGMNLDWSRKCLEETQWDYQRAAFVFTELHKENKIPPEAFIK